MSIPINLAAPTGNADAPSSESELIPRFPKHVLSEAKKVMDTVELAGSATADATLHAKKWASYENDAANIHEDAVDNAEKAIEHVKVTKGIHEKASAGVEQAIDKMDEAKSRHNMAMDSAMNTFKDVKPTGFMRIKQ